MSSLIRDVRARVSLSGLALVVLFISVIWGNSLIAGEGSGSLSLVVVECAQGFLRAIGLPSIWVTNLLVRKAAHFTEYFLLAILALRAFDPRRDACRESIVAAGVLCVLVSSIDETIQLFVPGRCGQVADVFIDCCGASLAIVARTMLARRRNRRLSNV